MGRTVVVSEFARENKRKMAASRFCETQLAEFDTLPGMRFPTRVPAIAALITSGLVALSPLEAQEPLVADLDLFVTLPGAYQLTPDDLEKRFEKGNWNRNPYFEWLTEDRSRAIFQKKNLGNLKVDLTLLQGAFKVEEAVVDFKDGKFLGVTISIFNRGDGGSISMADYDQRFQAVGRHLGTQLQIRPTKREGKPSQGLLTMGYSWISARGKAVLERNAPENAPVEYLRMRLAKRDAGGVYEAAMQDRAGATVKLSELPLRVKKSGDGDVFIAGVPMVDQGAKGYCVVASAQRLFEYYGIACDMHQLAEIAGSDPEQGTSILATNEELGRIDHLFKTRFTCLAVRQGYQLVELLEGRYVGPEVPKAKYHEAIRKHVDQGIPLLWSLEVGQFPEDPPLHEQTSGGHMRMIIGYNEAKKQILFSDSWGSGHELKRMDAEHAYQATHGLFVMKPTTR